MVYQSRCLSNKVPVAVFCTTRWRNTLRTYDFITNEDGDHEAIINSSAE